MGGLSRGGAGEDETSSELLLLYSSSILAELTWNPAGKLQACPIVSGTVSVPCDTACHSVSLLHAFSGLRGVLDCRLDG